MQPQRSRCLHVRTEGVEVVLVVAGQLEVFQAMPAGQDAVGIVEKRGGHLHTGNTGTTCMVDTLAERGRGDVMKHPHIVGAHWFR